ncbi:response regulator transcription factor [Flectobacillus sp. DC10W]|jgi:DNA-binding response OmpR family regulator|uniref:Response regulator transcription factor n=1 Tax=Flectobacillus longus TaxID=2984207 RepID=A0ABT6YV97_9BACT|nr:response regulator transcription factor [Flectobacillus longus]MDI9867528.1 response regulator transcription factor [Flectobacillus longus]
MEKQHILIVEDEQKVANFIKKGLETQSFEALIAEDGQTAINTFSKHTFDLVILDIGLPGMSGLEVCAKIRESNTQVPILMLTALGSMADKLSGFEVGTDDYLVKPFDFMELLVRVKALLKRSTPSSTSPNEILKVADLELDLAQKLAFRGGRQIELTAKEYSLLEYLMRNRGRVISKVDIAENVWDINFDTGTNFIEVYINYLRNKVDKGFENKLIHTVVGMGYVLKAK